MNLHALRVFYYVARIGNVTKASEELHISQPAVTQHIRKLEQELGVKLVHPAGRGVGITYAGEELHRMASKLFAVEQEIEHRMIDIAAGKRGELTIAATYLPATELLPKHIAMFKASHEEITINVMTGNSEEAFELIRNQTADLAIIGGAWESPNVQWEHLMDDELWFIVPPGHRLAGAKVSLQEMLEETFVIREEGSSTRERFLSMCRTYNVRQPKIGMQFNGLYETIKAVSAGYGANLISAMAVRDFAARGEVARVYVRDVDLKRPIALCTVKHAQLPPIADEFVRFIGDKLRREREDGGWSGLVK